MGSDDVLAAKEGLPSSVRVLGAGVGAEVTKPPLEGIVDQKGDNGQKIPAADVLEERIATARSGVVSKGNLEEKAESKGGLVRRTLPLGYFAQVAAPKKLAEAEGVAKRLKKAGFPVLVESATVNGQGFYRVVVGPEDNKEQVDRLVKQLQKESLAGSSKPFIRRVK
jgi:septal ring-binding cell division protein DamX